MNFKLTISPAIEAGNPFIQFMFESKLEAEAASNTCADLLLFMQDKAGVMDDYSNSFVVEQKIDGEWVDLCMNKKENALVIFKEELGELAIEILKLQQQVSKAIRFGIDEQRDLPTSNRERIESEWNDLLGSLHHLNKVGISLKPSICDIRDKVNKIEKYNKYSESLGTLTKDQEGK